MKRILIFTYIASFLAIPLQAARLTPSGTARLTPWVSYTTVTMDALNENMEATGDGYGFFGMDVEHARFTDGLAAGFDYGMLRLGCLTSSSRVTGSVGETVFERRFNVSLIPVMLGKKLSLGSNIGVSLYAGYSYLMMDEVSTILNFFGDSVTTGPLEGYGPAAEFMVNIEFSALVLNLGYRYAVVDEVFYSSDVLFNGDGAVVSNKGDTLMDGGEPLPVDLTGIIISIGFKFGDSYSYSSYR